MRQIAPAEPIVFVLNYAEYVNEIGVSKESNEDVIVSAIFLEI